MTTRFADEKITVNGTNFVYTEVAETFSAAFLRLLASYRHRLETCRPDTIRQHISALRNYTKYLSSISTEPVSVYLRNHTEVPMPSWAEFIAHLITYRRLIVDAKAKSDLYIASECSASKHISSLNFWLSEFCDYGIVPSDLRIDRLSLTEQNAREKVREAGKATTVLDYSSNFELSQPQQDELERVLATIDRENENAADIREIYTNTVKELVASKIDFEHGINQQTLSRLVTDALAKRLNRIRDRAEEVFTEELDLMSDQRELAKKGVKYEPLIRRFFTVEVGSGNRNPYREEVLGLTAEEVSAGLLATYADPSSPFYLTGVRERDIKIYQRLRKLRKLLGVKSLPLNAEALFGATRRLQAAGHLILIHEFAANVSPIRNMRFDAGFSVASALKVLEIDKLRANWKRFTEYDTLLKTKPWRTPHEAYAVLKKETEFFRTSSTLESIADGLDDPDVLLFVNVRDKFTDGVSTLPVNEYRITQLSDEWFNVHTKGILSGIADGVTAKSIRPSLLLLEGLIRGASAAQDKGKHVTLRTTSSHYLNKLAYSMDLEEKMRQFLLWLEALVTLDIEDYAKKVGYDPVEFEELREHVRNDGFGGVVCKDPNAGYQKGSEKGDGCGKFRLCLLCDQREPVFFTSYHNVVHVVLWGEAIKQAIAAGTIQQGDQDYLMWCYFIDSIYIRLQEDPAHKAMLTDALNEAKAIDNPYLKVIGAKDAG